MADAIATAADSSSANSALQFIVQHVEAYKALGPRLINDMLVTSQARSAAVNAGLQQLADDLGTQNLAAQDLYKAWQANMTNLNRLGSWLRQYFDVNIGLGDAFPVIVWLAVMAAIAIGCATAIQLHTSKSADLEQRIAYDRSVLAATGKAPGPGQDPGSPANNPNPFSDILEKAKPFAVVLAVIVILPPVLNLAGNALQQRRS